MSSAPDAATNATTSSHHTVTVPWVIGAAVLNLLGIGVSLYATLHHLEVHAKGSTDAVCNINATFNCDSVAMSDYSSVGGIPLGVFGIGFFVAQLVLLFLGRRREKSARENLRAYGALTIIGVITSLVLAGVSVGALGSYCVSCMGIYALTFINAGMVWSARRAFPKGMDIKELISGGATAAIAVAVVVIIFNAVKPKSVAPPQPVTSTGEPLPSLADKAQDIPIAKSAYSGLGEDYRRGNENATIVIVEFADFQCPACGQLEATMQQIMSEFGDKVMLVFRNYPLDSACNTSVRGKMHEFACKASVMGRCAGRYGKFWQFHDKAFANQKDLNDANLKQWGRDLGLTDDQINACWDDQDLLAKVKDDVEVANKVGVNSTPTLFINGRKVMGGRGLAELRNEIERQL